MRQPTVQPFRRSLLLFAVYLVHVTTVPSGANPHGTSIPQNNDNGNITGDDLSSYTITPATSELFNIESNISFSKKSNAATTILTNTSQEPPRDNSIYESEFSDEITTSLSNVIPRNPGIRDIAPDQKEPMTTEDITVQPSEKEIVRPFQLDNTIDNFISPTWSSSDSNLNEIITKSFHASDVEPTALTKIKLPSQDNDNSPAEDVPPNGKETVKLLTKLSADSEDHRIPKTKDPNEDIILQISLSNSGDSMMVNWLFSSNNTEVSGFKVSYRMNNREDFDSSSLDISVRSFALHSLHEDEHYVICVHAIVNDTVVESSCAEWSQTSMKMVVGILAGTIFLIPCIIVMGLILYKDHKMKQKDRLQLVNDDTAAGNKQLISCKHHPHVHLQSYHDEVKGDKTDGQTCPTEASSVAYNSQKSLNRYTQDTGHENPCGHAADDSTDDDDAHGPWQRRSNQDVDMVSIPLTDELVSTSPGASISSKNNITYIMIRSNSNDQIIHQNTDNLSPSQDSIRL